MAEDDLARTVGEMIAASGVDDSLTYTFDLVKGAGGCLAREAGKIGLGILIQKGIGELASRIRKAKEEKKIPEDFESTEHGATLLQEALNALLEGLDHERAEAVKSVFLGLAMTPVEVSLEKVQQIEIMRITSSLTTWEVVLINALERYSKEVYDPMLAQRWKAAQSAPQQEDVRKLASKDITSFDAWLKVQLCKRDKACLLCLEEATNSLYGKHILTYNFQFSQNLSSECVYLRQGAFTDFGWKLAVHIYAATED